MRIIHIAAEFAPLAKAGGLGDVLFGLPKELLAQGQDVEIVLPLYDIIDRSLFSIKSQEKISDDVSAIKAECDGCHVTLLEESSIKKYFRRGALYGEKDDACRFLFFCFAALAYLQRQTAPIDILHLHDWHAACLAYLVEKTDSLVGATVLTIHNAGYVGHCALHDLETFNLTDLSFLTQIKDGAAYSLLKAGLVFADQVTTVSDSYAEELMKSHPLFQSVHLTGIINGIDRDLWSPAKDPFLLTNYTQDTVLSGKAAARDHIAALFNLDPTCRPWVGSITRLVHQKAPHLITRAMYKTATLQGTFILLGSSPVPEIQNDFELLKRHAPLNVYLELEYDEKLAHLLYAALDILIVPSFFEPCGLVQMVAMNYGTIPVAHATGGLKDTILERKTGFLFAPAEQTPFDAALQEAVHLFRTNPKAWEQMQQRGMLQNFSWSLPAKKYLELYRLANMDTVCDQVVDHGE